MASVVHRRITAPVVQDEHGEGTPLPVRCVTGGHVVDAEGEHSPEFHRAKTNCRQRNSLRELTVGIAAMKRVKSETLVSNVLDRMTKLARRNMLIHVEELHEGNVDEWQPCSVLWILWTPDFPMEKLKAYVKNFKPVELNSLDGLLLLLDRRNMMRTCVESKIPVPHFIECSRDGANDPVIEETDEHICINGERLDKPFLEKPADATDFSMFVYFPASARGGRVRVGRMGFDSASDQMPGPSNPRVRRESSYIYAQFIPSEGFDLQVLVAGSSYVHGEVQHNMQTLGETSGSPSMPVLLEFEEKQLAQKVRLAFNLAMFRVSMVRAQEGAAAEGSCKTYVIEVDPEYGGMPRKPQNGDLVDDSLIDDIARAILAQIRARVECWKLSHTPPVVAGKEVKRNKTWQGGMLPQSWRAPKWNSSSPNLDAFGEDEEDPLSALPETEEEGVEAPVSRKAPQLLAVLAVVRHGDRTPKQKVKLKLKVSKLASDARLFLGMLIGWIMGANQNAKSMLSSCASEVELRSEGQLQRLYSILKEVAGLDCDEHKHTTDESPFIRTPTPKPHLLETASPKDHSLLLAACDVLGKLVSNAGAASNVHAKIEANGEALKVSMKWGGDLTKLGEEQARGLGMRFKQNVYPDEDTSRMHATLRHDLKVHSSSEPRCAQTAAAFAQGLLSIRAALAAIQVSFVRLDNLGRLDNTPFARSPLVEKAKEEAVELLDSDRVVDAKFQEEVLCEPSRYLRAHANLEALQQQGTTVRTELQHCARSVLQLCSQLAAVIEQEQAGCCGSLMEVLPLALQRWTDLAKDFTGDTPLAPPGKVANILDNVKYDMRHTIPLLDAIGEIVTPVIEAIQEVHKISARVSSYSELVECGSSQNEKFEIARTFLQPMLRKMRWDLRAASGQELGDESHHLVRHRELYRPALALSPEEATVRSRLYFAHNSHLQTFLNLLRWAPAEWRFLSEEGEAFLANMELPLGYMSHLVIKLWGLSSAGGVKDHAVRLEFSPGDSGPDGVSASTVIADGVQLQKFDAFLSKQLDVCQSIEA